jgi:hypothetical protein
MHGKKTLKRKYPTINEHNFCLNKKRVKQHVFVQKLNYPRNRPQNKPQYKAILTTFQFIFPIKQLYPFIMYSKSVYQQEQVIILTLILRNFTRNFVQRIG